MPRDIQIIAAPSNLGLKPNGVEMMANSLLDAGLARAVGATHPVVQVPTLNSLYNPKRDEATLCLNPTAIQEFSGTLANTMSATLQQKRFALVLGGDCSILLGIMPALKKKGQYGLVYIDAHADFINRKNPLPVKWPI
jgi:Arginase/agmatinase/formimionoglutamate hydrolase, arginase family